MFPAKYESPFTDNNDPGVVVPMPTLPAVYEIFEPDVVHCEPIYGVPFIYRAVAFTIPETSSLKEGEVVPTPRLPFVIYVFPEPFGVIAMPPLRTEVLMEGVDNPSEKLTGVRSEDLIVFPAVRVILLFNKIEPPPEAGLSSIFPPPVVCKTKF